MNAYTPIHEVDELRAEIKRLTALTIEHAQITGELVKDNERLRAPWRAVDAVDWDYVMGSLGHGGRDRFWKEVLTEMRRALEPKP